MSERERLIVLLTGKSLDTDADIQYVADFLLDKDIFVAPFPICDRLRKELSEHINKRCLEEHQKEMY